MRCPLIPHPARPPRSTHSVTCALRRDAAALDLVYTIGGDRQALVLPPAAAPVRTDGLWRTTCLELFVAGQGGGYREFNFAPSGQWAAYGFTGRRVGLAPLDLASSPTIRVEENADGLAVNVHLPGIGTRALRLGITAVIEETGSIFSYWALRHGGDAPDFHDPDCFVLQLPPAV